jgi:gliding motility-associated-like protein
MTKFTFCQMLPDAKSPGQGANPTVPVNTPGKKADFFVLLLWFVFCLNQNIKAQAPTFSYSSPACTNGPTVAPTTSGNFVFGGTFTFAPGGLNLNALTGVVNPGASSPGNYVITYASTAAPVFATIAIINPVIPIIAGPSSICAGSSVTITASGLASYTWVNTGQTTATMTDTPLSSGIYTLQGVDPNGCKIIIGSSLTVNQPPANLTIIANSTVCAGYAFSLTASGATSYTWSTGQTTPGIVSVPPTNPTTYSVVGSTSGCTVAAYHTVNLVPIPSVSIVGSNTVCQFAHTTWTAIAFPGPVTYSWSSGSSDDTLNVSPVSTLPLTFTVWAIDANGCAGWDVKTVTVKQRPVVTISGKNPVCSDDKPVYTGSGANSYTWNTGAFTSTTQPVLTSDFSLTVIGMNSDGCVGESSLFLTYLESPTISVSSPTACSGTSVVIESTVTANGAVSFQWFPSGSTNPTVAVNLGATTFYTVQATEGPCKTTVVSTVTIIKSVSPNTNFSYNGPFCSGTLVSPNLKPNFTMGGVFTATGVVVDQNTGQLDLTDAATGFYGVTYTYAPVGCTIGGIGYASFTVNKTVYISMEPHLEILPGTSVTLVNSGGVESYIWDPYEGLNCTYCQAPVASPQHTTKYCVSSAQACVIGTCVDVEVLCVNGGDFSIPNAFTPNKDGRNEKFCLQGWNDCMQEFNIKVFDRWGGVVYETGNPNFCWDGTSNGQDLPSGVYMYVINARYAKDPAFTKSGNITLIR